MDTEAAPTYCPDCHASCPNCLAGTTFDDSGNFFANFCTCIELQRAHVEKAHNVLLGQPPEWQYPAFLDELTDNDLLNILPDNIVNGADSVLHQPRDQDGRLIEQIEQIFRGVPPNDAPLVHSSSKAQDRNDDNVESTALFRINGTSDMTAKLQPEVSPHNEPNRTSRRRDYTQAEKESFEKWIVNNATPNKEERAEYANQNNLTKSQLQARINNYRSRNRNRSRHRIQSRNRNRSRNQSRRRPTKVHPSGNASTYSNGSGPVSYDLETLNSLSTQSSYDSIGEYLKSPEDAAVLESVKQVAFNNANFLTPRSSRPKSTKSSLGSDSVHSATSSASRASIAYSFSSSRSRTKKRRREKSIAKAIAKYYESSNNSQISERGDNNAKPTIDFHARVLQPSEDSINDFFLPPSVDGTTNPPYPSEVEETNITPMTWDIRNTPEWSEFIKSVTEQVKAEVVSHLKDSIASETPEVGKYQAVFDTSDTLDNVQAQDVSKTPKTPGTLEGREDLAIPVTSDFPDAVQTQVASITSDTVGVGEDQTMSDILDIPDDVQTQIPSGPLTTSDTPEVTEHQTISDTSAMPDAPDAVDGQMESQLASIDPSQPATQLHRSVFASFAKRTKTFLEFARMRRKHGK